MNGYERGIELLQFPSDATAAAMLRLCSDHFDHLCNAGCDMETAADRTWDAYECAYTDASSHCYDPRDKPFEDRLRNLARKDTRQEGQKNEIS